MIPPGDSRIGQELYRLLPEVYRKQDDHIIKEGKITQQGDLASYLDACGFLLDGIYSLLKQRLADTFIESCQPWLIPYMARLLGVHPVMFSESGKRAEVASSVTWRQRKGTLSCVRDIWETLIQTPFEIHEGWRRVATTARIGMPLVPPDKQGRRSLPVRSDPLDMARHPNLPSVTVDFRAISQALPGTSLQPDSRQGWHCGDPHGVPRFPDCFDDLSKRTVDFHTPDWRRGHYHPKRMLLFAWPCGFFTPGQLQVLWGRDEVDSHEEIRRENGRYISYHTIRGRAGTSIRIDNRGLLAMQPGKLDEIVYCVEDTDLNRTLTILTVSCQYHPAEDCYLWTMAGQTEEPVRIRGRIASDTFPESMNKALYRFENLCLENTLTIESGRLELERVAAFRAIVYGDDNKEPLLQARDSLLNGVQVARGLVHLEYCTVLGQPLAEGIQASNCLLLGEVRKDHLKPDPPDWGYVRYSRISPQQIPGKLFTDNTCTQAHPVFFSASFGKPGCGVLHPATPDAIRFGTEDGDELGAFHHVGLRTVQEKLKVFLPLGMEVVMIPDERVVKIASART